MVLPYGSIDTTKYFTVQISVIEFDSNSFDIQLFMKYPLEPFFFSFSFAAILIWLDLFWFYGISTLAGYSYLPTPPLGQNMTQGQFLSEV